MKQAIAWCEWQKTSEHHLKYQYNDGVGIEGVSDRDVVDDCAAKTKGDMSGILFTENKYS